MRIIFVLILSFICFDTHAQIACNLVLKSGERLSGKMNVDLSDATPRSFAVHVDDVLTTFTAKELLRLETSDLIYVSAIVDLLDEDKSVYKLNDVPSPRLRKDTVFLEEYTFGAKSFYLNIQKGDAYNFFIKKENDYELLIHKSYLKKASNGNEFVAENNQFQNQLFYYFLDCQKIQEKISKATYSKKSIFQVFSMYQASCDSVGIFSKNEKFKPEIAFGGGLLFASVFLSSESLENIKYIKSPQIGAGKSAFLFFEAKSRNPKKRQSYYSELGLCAYRHKARILAIDDGIIEQFNNTEIGVVQLRSAHFLRLHSKEQNKVFKPYVGFGVLVNYLLRSKSELHREYSVVGSDTNYTEKTPNFMNPSLWELGIGSQFGLRSKNLSFEFRYQLSSGHFRYERKRGAINLFGFCVAFFLPTKK